MTASPPSLLGVVLAGGESRRFGSHKALATLDGEPLWARAVRVLREAGMDALVAANDPGVAARVTVPVRADVRTRAGPLAGIETGLVHAGAEGRTGILALACDLVQVEADLLLELVRAWSGRGAAAFAAPGPWGVEPLCAIWGLDVLPAVSAALDAGNGSPGALLAGSDGGPRMAVRLVDADVDPRVFRSANRAADLTDDPA